MKSEELITALVELVLINIANDRKNIAKDIVTSLDDRELTIEDINLVYQSIKLSTAYSFRYVLQTLHELNLIDLNRYEPQGGVDLLRQKIEFLKHHRVIENPKNIE